MITPRQIHKADENGYSHGFALGSFFEDPPEPYDSFVLNWVFRMAYFRGTRASWNELK